MFSVIPKEWSFLASSNCDKKYDLREKEQICCKVYASSSSCDKKVWFENKFLPILFPYVYKQWFRIFEAEFQWKQKKKIVIFRRTCKTLLMPKNYYKTLAF